MTCPRCGNVEEPDSAYCSACGAALASTAPAEPAAGFTAAGLPPAAPPPPAAVPSAGDYASSGPAWPARQPVQLAGPQRSASGAGGLLLGIGAILILINIVLQFMKISYDGLSESPAQVNGLCQSTIGQLGQEFSSRLGYGTPQNLCGKAAAIEDWKTVTLWLGIVLIGTGLFVIARRAGWLSARPGPQAQQSPPARPADR